MALSWTRTQHASLDATYASHPPSSNACIEAAQEALPVAREQDGEANTHKLVSDGLVLPRSGPPWFYFHVTVATRGHEVDAFTGATGYPAQRYVEAWWQHPEALRWVPFDDREAET